MLLCDSCTSACLLSVLFLTSHFGFCNGSLTDGVKISRDEDTRYPEITTPQGIVRGIYMLTHYNRTISSFLGIPYAQPPVGDLRFKAPVSPKAWNGTFDASTEAKPCPQFDSQNQIVGEEDCLYLNLFTPHLPETENSALLPVMVFSLGGGFQTGNNSMVRFSPDFLLDKDVVLVVPNFRVGVLGYLSTGDEVSPGNYGLKDMVRVLEWIQVSIRSFGGDPNAVTLYGSSSGAISVHLLALSKLTDGLIHKYITQSGTALSGIVNQPKEVCANRAIQLGEYLGCPTNASTLLVNCLRGFNVSQLLETRSIFYVWRTYPSYVWHPTSEPDIDGALLIDTPEALFAAGKIRDLPWISSVATQGEGYDLSARFYEDPDFFEDFLDNIDLALPAVIGYGISVDDIAALKAYYLNDLTANRRILLANLTELMGDARFVYPSYKAFQKQLVHAKSPQYFCSFGYRGTFSTTYFYSKNSTKYPSVAHGEELIYLFKIHDSRFGHSEHGYNENDLIMVDTMVQLWTSFATNGIPTIVNSANTDIWDPYSSLNNYLQIGNESDTDLEMKYDLFAERMKFWAELHAPTSGGLGNQLGVVSIGLCFCSFSFIS